jgi:hypothetical protein
MTFSTQSNISVRGTAIAVNEILVPMHTQPANEKVNI